jgi:DnaJ-class molecular chaperone
MSVCKLCDGTGVIDCETPLCLDEDEECTTCGGSGEAADDE